jgi:hypothetical protein
LKRASTGLFALGNTIEHDLSTATAGEHHLGNRGEQTTIRAVVISQDNARLMELLDGIEVVGDEVDIANIWTLIAELATGLRKCRATHSLLAHSKIHEHEKSLANILVSAKGRGPGVLNLTDGGEGRDDNSSWSSDRLGLASLLILPRCLHGCRVLTNWNADTKLWAHLHANSLNSLVQGRALTLVVDGGHPVGG